MSGASIEVSGPVEQLLSLDGQLDFAAARALTEAAKQGQSASIRAIERTFTTRGRWYLPGNRFGVRVTPASKGRLEAAVHTEADWLALHEMGGTKRAGGRYLAVPVVGPGTARPRLGSKLRRELKPRALGPKAFVLQTRSGPVLFYRRGGRLTALYNLERSAHIRRRSVVVEPTTEVIERRFEAIYAKSLEGALATVK